MSTPRCSVSMTATSSPDPLARLGSHRVREIFVQARVLLISHAKALFDEPIHRNIEPTTSLHHHYQQASIKESVIDLPHPAQATSMFCVYSESICAGTSSDYLNSVRTSSKASQNYCPPPTRTRHCHHPGPWSRRETLHTRRDTVSTEIQHKITIFPSTAPRNQEHDLQVLFRVDGSRGRPED